MAEKGKMIKVCLFCEKWGSGGIESFLMNVIRHLEPDKFRITIVAAKIESSFAVRHVNEFDIPLVLLSGKLWDLPKNHRMFRRFLRENSFDAVHFNIYHALSVLYVLDAKWAGIGIRIAHSHNDRLRPSFSKPLKECLHAMCKHLFKNAATDFWAASAPAARFMFSKKTVLEGSVKFVPNGIDIERFKIDHICREKFRREHGLTDHFVIGNVGRLCRQKNQSFLIDVFEQVQAYREDSILLLVGEGEDEQMLREKAEKLGISDKVILWGTTQQIEMLYWAMDVFAFPSVFEGLGIAMLEAQAAGIPVICSDRIPEEASVTPLVCRIPLESGSRVWALKILETCGDGTYDTSVALYKHGYDIRDVAWRIQQIYSGTRSSEVAFRAVEVDGADL